MIKKILILAIISALAGTVSGQALTEFLDRVSLNNPEILAYNKLLEARKFEARTGLTPPNPFLSGGFMPGNTDEAGTKKLWSVTQSFAFPTKYLLQKKINRNTIILAEQEFSQGRLNILLDAKLTVYDLIYNTKSLNLLNSRKEAYDRLQSVWKKMFENGATTIMDYNRILMELSSLRLGITRREADIDMLRKRLEFISGSTLPEIDEYTATAEPAVEELLKAKAGIHPAFLIPETEYQISLQEVKLSRTGSLPELEIGYTSEILPGESYTGPVGGISIPLWSNANKVKTASAQADHSAALRDAALLKLGSDISREYLNMKALQKSLNEIRSILESSGGTWYLDTALSSGEITVTTYFSYLEVIYQSEDRLLELENEYHKSLAILLDHELIW